MPLTKEQVLDKVQKLLALATSPNEHEAALAAVKAQDLLFQHKLTMTDVEGHINDGEVVSEAVIPMGINKWRSHAWTDILMDGVTSTTYCQYLIGSINRQYYIIGRPTDVEVAKQLYWWLKHQCERLSLDAMKKHGRRDEKFKTSFLYGCSIRVRKRLMDEFFYRNEGAGAIGNALVVSSKKEISEFINKQYPSLGKAKQKQGPKDWGAYYAGSEAGDKVKLQKHKEVKDEGKGKLLH